MSASCGPPGALTGLSGRGTSPGRVVTTHPSELRDSAEDGETTGQHVAGWVEPGWVAAVRDPRVTALLSIPPGLELMAALRALPPGPCPADHGEDALVVTGPVQRWVHPDGPVQTLVEDGETAPGEHFAILPLGEVPGLPCACQLVVTAGWATCVAWAQSRLTESTLAVAGGGPLEIEPGRAGVIIDPAREELAVALHVSPRTAGSRIGTARDRHLCRALTPAVDAGLLGAGAISAICDVFADLPSVHADRLSRILHARVLERRAEGRGNWTPAQARNAARAALLRHAGDLVAKVHEAARSERRVELQPNGDGTSWLHALLPEIEALRIFRRLSAQARARAADSEPNDRRRLDQHRADLLTDSLLGCSGVQPEPPGAQRTGTLDHGSESPPPNPDPSSGAGPVPTAADICVVASLDTLLGMADTPAHIPGLGPVSADTARELAADGLWRIWLTDAAGLVTATGTRRYRPGPALARLITARETTCRFPGCTMAAEKCDIDHAIPWPSPPGTSQQNLGPLCRRHHKQKTHLSHRLTTHEDDSGNTAGWTWTLPSGLATTRRVDAPLEADLGSYRAVIKSPAPINPQRE